jgi:hypothetical protein
MKTIAIRVSDEEHKLFTDLAEREFMPLSVLVRRTLRAETVRVGLTLDPAEEARRVLEAQAKAALAPQKPVIERRPIPSTGWRAEIVARVDGGEKLADVAESYGQSVDLIKQQYKSGKEQQEAARDFGEMRKYAEASPVQELVYAPVDPDNPTEEEQATNAEIARRKLVDMGLL